LCSKRTLYQIYRDQMFRNGEPQFEDDDDVTAVDNDLDDDDDDVDDDDNDDVDDDVAADNDNDAGGAGVDLDEQASSSFADVSSAALAAKTAEENLLALAFDLPSPPSDPARLAVEAEADGAGALKMVAEADELPNVPSTLLLPSGGSGGGGDGGGGGGVAGSSEPRRRRASSAAARKAAQDKTTKLKEFYSSISQDVPRTMSDLMIFQTAEGESTAHGEALERALFIYTALNSGVGYTQGMNDLLAMIYHTFLQDTSPDAAEHVEADAFWCFSNLLIELSVQRLLRHGGDDAGGVVWTDRLSELLAERDAQLAAHIRALSQQHDTDLLRHCTYRWFVVLLSREFDMQGAVRVWDMLLSDSSRFTALLFAAYATLDLMRPQLLDADAQAATDLIKMRPALIGADAVIRRTRVLMESRGSFKEAIRPAMRNARDKLAELSSQARKKLNDGSKRIREWRNSKSASASPRFTWSRPADDAATASSPPTTTTTTAAAAAFAGASATAAADARAHDLAQAAVVAFELPDVPTGPAIARALPPRVKETVTQAAAAELLHGRAVYKPRTVRGPSAESSNSARSGWAERQGRRSTMEDAESVVDDVLALYPALAEAVGVSSASFYGVYDGHAGARAAAYLAAHLLDVVVACLVESRARTDEEREAALLRAFRLCDQRLMETSVAESWEDGSTAVVCLQLDNRLYMANAGDAESVVGIRAGDDEFKAECLTLKHKPTDESERERIQGAGGFVIFGRISGMLGVSRAFGDRPFKVPYSKTQGDLVTVDPYTRSYAYDESHRFLLVACDGLFDVFSYEEVIDFTAAKLADGVTPHELAELLVDEALALGSLDNVTCIVVFLHEKIVGSGAAAAVPATTTESAEATPAATPAAEAAAVTSEPVTSQPDVLVAQVDEPMATEDKS